MSQFATNETGTLTIMASSGSSFQSMTVQKAPNAPAMKNSP